MSTTPPEIIHVVELFEDFIRRFFFVRDHITVWGKFEAQDEGYLMAQYIVRTVESVITLARRDAVLIPAALMLSRVAFEVSMRLYWLIDPAEPFAREVRWVALAEEKDVYYTQLVKLYTLSNPEMAKKMEDRRESYYFFVKKTQHRLRQKFKGKYETFKKATPRMSELLKMFQHDKHYADYRLSSQYAHGNQVALDLYRRRSGNDWEFGEFVTGEDWYHALNLCWFGLRNGAMVFLQKYHRDMSHFKHDHLETRIDEALHCVAGIGEIK